MEQFGTSALGAPFGDNDYKLLCKRVEQQFRIRLSDYKPDQMMRRVASLARQVGCQSFANYVALIERDRKALEDFLNLMTINVTEFFRNSSLFDELSKEIIPSTISNRATETYKIWSAGCSNGSEAYTLAMIFAEMYPDRPYSIKGTDIDLTMIARASSPSFSAQELAGVNPLRRDRFFSSPDDQNFVPKLLLRKNCHFFRHDLLADPYGTDEFDLILCRNVVIYFNDDAKERIYQGFFRALKPGGVLFVGGTERIGTAQKIGYESIRPFFYRKPAVAASGLGLRRAA